MEIAPRGGIRDQPVVVLLAAVLAGIARDRFLAVSLPIWPVLAVGCLVLWRIARYFDAVRSGAWLVLLAAFSLAGLWHHLQWRRFDAGDLGRCAGPRSLPICVEVLVHGSPRHHPAQAFNPLNTVGATEEWRFEVQILHVRDGSAWRDASGVAMVRLSERPAGIRSGDRLQLFGQLVALAGDLNPGETDFADYERAERRLCRLEVDSAQCVRIVSRGRRAGLTGWLDGIRDHGHANLARNISPSHSGLASAVLLGMREQIDPGRMEEYMVMGTVHLLSISGLHVGILAGGFWLLARCGWVSRRKTLVAAVALVIIYTLLTEARPPVVRAAVLVTVMCAARFLGRQAFSGSSLAMAGLVVTGLNPSAFFHAGTQLSFLAVATIACLPGLAGQPQPVDPLTRLVAESRPWLVRVARRVAVGILRAFGFSTAIWLSALPLVAYRFHLVSPVATLLNPLICLPMTVALFTGLGAMLLGGIAPPLAAGFGWACDLSLTSMEWCQQQALGWQGSHWWTPAPPGWWVGCFYGVAAFWVIWPGTLPARRWLIALVLSWLALGGWLTVGGGGRVNGGSGRELVCTFISVGHGTSVVLEFPSGHVMLYDAGRLGIASAGTRSVSSVLWSRGITHLDAVVVSHADADHFNALPDLLRRFSVGVAYVSPVMFRHESAALSALRASFQTHGIRVGKLSAGDRLGTGDGTRLTVLHPPASGTDGSDNANSIVLLIEFAGRRILLPGDLESPGLEQFLRQPPVDCDVIMAPHHGSARSDPIGFGRWSTPEHVVISGGISRDARAVKSAYESLQARVYHTAESGAVRVIVGGGECRVTSFRAVAEINRIRLEGFREAGKTSSFRTSGSPASW